MGAFGKDTIVRSEFYAGFGMACATLARDLDQPTAAASILATYGVFLADLEKSGLPAFDLKTLRKLYRTEPKLIRKKYTQAASAS